MVRNLRDRTNRQEPRWEQDIPGFGSLESPPNGEESPNFTPDRAKPPHHGKSHRSSRHGPPPVYELRKPSTSGSAFLKCWFSVMKRIVVVALAVVALTAAASASGHV